MDLDNNKTEQQMDMTEEEIVNAYLNQLDADTPDLWDRIEAGLDTYENVSSIKNIENIEKKRKKKTPIKWIPTVVSLAALLLAALLVLPYLAGGRRKASDSAMDTNGAVSKDEAENWFSNDAVADEAYDSDSLDSVHGNYINGSANEDTNGDLTQAQDQTSKNDDLDKETVGSTKGDVETDEQNISCVLQVVYETDEGYHCEIISIDENPYDLSSCMEIDVVSTQGELSVSEDTTVQVEICNRQEDGYYVVLVK